MSTSAKLKKYGSILLVLLTFITLFCGWISMNRVNYKGYVSSSDFTGGFVLMADYVEYEGMPVDTMKVLKMSSKMIGNVSPGNLGYAFSVMAEIIGKMEKTEYYYDYMVGAPQVLSMMNSVKTLSVFVNLFFYLSIAMALFSLFMNLANKKYWGYGLLLSIIGLAICSIASASTINNFLLAEYEVSTAVTFVSTTAWPYISIVLAAAAAALWFMYVKETGYKLTANGTSIKAGFQSTLGDFSFGSGMATTQDWICPNCSTAMPGSNKFCATCGSPRPEPKKCPHCGNGIANESMFCGRCGGQYYETQRCVACGVTLNPGTLFCVSCGTSQSVQVQQPADRPAAQEQPEQTEPIQPEM